MMTGSSRPGEQGTVTIKQKCSRAVLGHWFVADRRERVREFPLVNASGNPSAIFQSEGDLNLSSQRHQWSAEHIDAETRRWLDEDAKYFLHQSLSTPCLNVLRACEGACIEDIQGRRLLDFHGNNVHQVGFGNERVIAAVVEQM